MAWLQLLSWRMVAFVLTITLVVFVAVYAGWWWGCGAAVLLVALILMLSLAQVSGQFRDEEEK